MSDPRLEAHACGVELQLNELHEQLARARQQRRPALAAALEHQVADLIDDLATTAEALANPHFGRPSFHGDARHAA